MKEANRGGHVLYDSTLEGRTKDAIVGSSHVGNVQPCGSFDSDECFERSGNALVREEGTVRFHPELGGCLEEAWGPVIS